jgi:hypothetical protein
MPKTEADAAIRSRWLAIAFGIVTIIVLVMYLMSGYGEISSQAYQYARSLYTVCNQKDAQRLDKVVAMIEADYKAEKLTDRDHSYLMGLVQLAKDGKWTDAQERIRSLLEAQVKME